MLMLTKVNAAFGDVRCPVCAAAFRVVRVQARTEGRRAEQRWVEEALQAQHSGQGRADVHAPAFPVAAKSASVPMPMPQRARRPESVLGLPAFS